MKRDLLLGAAVFAITLGGLLWYTATPEQLTEAERQEVRSEMKDEFRAALREKLTRFREGRLTDQERADVAAAQKQFGEIMEKAMTTVATELDLEENEVDLMAGRDAANVCLDLWEDEKAYGECLERSY